MKSRRPIYHVIILTDDKKECKLDEYIIILCPFPQRLPDYPKWHEYILGYNAL